MTALLTAGDDAVRALAARVLEALEAEHWSSDRGRQLRPRPPAQAAAAR